MLYDPKWDKQAETKVDPFTLESLIAWLEKQPANRRYDFWCLRCCLGNYFAHCGFDLAMMGTGTFTLNSGKCINLPPHFNGIAQETPHTYGAALERARAALTSTDGMKS